MLGSNDYEGSDMMIMRKLSSHVVNPANDRIVIEVLDEFGHGGACHEYMVKWPRNDLKDGIRISFQNGPIATVGVNGLTHEVLLAILEDRLVGFQQGEYRSMWNAIALRGVRLAQWALKMRTVGRMRRGVEGTHLK